MSTDTWSGALMEEASHGAKGRRGRTDPDRCAGPAGGGWPPKFGRASQVVALTLPRDVLDSLGTFHRGPGSALIR